MYPRPHLIWVAGSVAQLGPAEAIFEPGSAWGMPCAPEEALCAAGFQWLSRFHSESRQPNWSAPKPKSPINARAMSCGSPSLRSTELVVAGPLVAESARTLIGSASLRRSAEREVTDRSM